MKKVILINITALLTCFSVIAQETEVKVFPANQVITPHKIEVSYTKTVHILFPSAVRYIDLGSSDIIAGKAAGAENVVRVKATARNFTEETNFSVITADGSFYSFNTVYADNPMQSSIEMDDWLGKSSDNEIVSKMHVRFDSMGEQNPALVQMIMYNIYRQNKSEIRHIGCQRFGIQTLLKGIYIHGDILYLHVSMKNQSNVPFDTDFIRFKIVDKREAKRTAAQEMIIEPLTSYSEFTRVEGKQTARNVYAFRKMTIPDGKKLVIEIYERNGGRHQEFSIENVDIINAKLIDYLKLK